MKDFNSLEELEEYLNRMETESKAFREGLEKYKAEKAEKWKPEEDGEFYYIDIDGEVELCEHYNDFSDRRMLDIGNCFKTREEAEFEVERLKVINKIKKYSRPYNPNKNNFYIFYSPDEREFETFLEAFDEPCMGLYYFDSDEIARKAISEVGEERIKKYMFGMEK